jgi:PII-like signaling protein
MGYGAHSTIHEPRLLHATGDLPVVIEIVDSAEKVRAFLPTLDAMVQEGMATVAEVEIVAYGMSR